MLRIKLDMKGGAIADLTDATPIEEKRFRKNIDSIKEDLRCVIDRGDMIKIIPGRGCSVMELIVDLTRGL